MVKHIFAFALFFSFSAPSFAGNFATCIIDKMDEVQNDAAVYAVRKLCIEKYPGGMAVVEQGSGRGLFGFNSGSECTVKKSAKTSNRNAGLTIGFACRKLYDKPNPLDFSTK